jgi:hypothetical protein
LALLAGGAAADDQRAHFLWIPGSTQAGYALFDLPNLHSSPSTHPKT